MGQQIPLPPGTKLEIQAESGGISSYRIEEVVGYGGSCVVYRGKDLSAGEAVRTQIIKEFYPQAVRSIERIKDALLVSEEDRADFSERETQFLKGISTYSTYYEYDSSHTNPRPFLYGRANGTSYAVSDPAKGRVLSNVSRRELNLYTISSIMYSVCSAICKFHDQELLYLDCKPDNIYLCEVDGQPHIQLFDFDTVLSIRDIQNGNASYLSCSHGWSPPEQERWGRSAEKPGKEADIYAIGAVFFYLLTGKKPYYSPGDAYCDLGKIERKKFRWKKESEFLKKCTDRALEIVENIAFNTLRADHTDRYKDVSRLQKDFQDLCAITKGDIIQDQAIFSAISRGFSGIREDLYKEVSKLSGSVAGMKKALEQMAQTVTNENKETDTKTGGMQEGGKKWLLQIFITIALLAVLAGTSAAVLFGRHAGESTYSPALLESGMNDHLLLQLSNANHQYEMGIENWRRLDYTRAERDICLARDEISTQIAQSELETARVNNSLGCLYLDMGQYQKAYDYLNAAYVTFRDQLGEKSLEARAARASIAQYDYYTGNLDGALSETQYILDHTDGKREQEVVAAVSHLRAMVYDAQGNWELALGLYQEVLELYGDIAEDGELSQRLSDYANDPELTQSEKDSYTNVIRWMILTYYNISQVNLQKGDLSTAEEAAQKGLDLALPNVYIGRRNLTVSKLYMSLAAARSGMGDSKSALEDIDLAMRIQMNLFDFEGVYPGLTEVYDVYGMLLEEKGDTDQAMKYYQDAIDLALASYGENHPDTAAVYAAMGDFRYRQGEYTTSSSLLGQAVEIRKNILADNHPESAEIYYNLALAQEALGLWEEAAANLAHAAGICDHWAVTGQLREKLDNALDRLNGGERK